jgi:hypothetical protein
MNIFLILIVAVAVAGGAVMLLRRNIARRVRESVAAAGSSDGVSSEHQHRDTGKVAAVAQAYQRGEINPSTVQAAAKVLGISPEEAMRRLDTAATGSPGSAETTRVKSAAKSKQVDARRKKNKNAKRSRRTNRH